MEPTEHDGDSRESLNIWVPGSTKTELRAYAKRHGISVSAAANIIIRKGFDAERAEK
jgi:plasmid stability protein